MTRYYLDTSAAAKLLLDEAESWALIDVVDAPDAELVSTHLLTTELMRLAPRHGAPQEAVTDVLDAVDLHDLPASLFTVAGLLPGADLRSLDALHVAGAVRLGVDALLCYDRRLAAAARAAGVPTVAPGVDHLG